MKKKLLSLFLAGAMVASTSVSAFADTVNTVEKDGGTTNVTIKGSVDNESGESPAGTISVSVPTALSFNVDNKGIVTGTNITISNHGADRVDVSAVKFYDETPNSNIKVKTPTQLQESQDDRSNLYLSIRGNQSERAYFKSEILSDKKNGIYNDAGENQDEIKVSSIAGGGNDTLYLDGVAGKAALTGDNETAGVTDTFILTLKISKADK